MATDLGWEKWDEPFIADENTAFIKGQRANVGVYDDAMPQEAKWSKWSKDLPLLHGTIGPELIVRSGKPVKKQQKDVAPEKTAVNHLNLVISKANKKIRSTKKYGNYKTGKSITHSQD